MCNTYEVFNLARRELENTGFICVNCSFEVLPLSNGSYRNHCPNCLHSLHVDLKIPGDRLSTCKGVMKPICVEYNSRKGYQIVFKCTKCGYETVNKIAEDIHGQSDNMDEVYKLMRKSAWG